MYLSFLATCGQIRTLEIMTSSEIIPLPTLVKMPTIEKDIGASTKWILSGTKAKHNENKSDFLLDRIDWKRFTPVF